MLGNCMEQKINEPKKRKHWLNRAGLPLIIGGLGVLSFIGVNEVANFFFDKKIKSNKTTNYCLEKFVEFETEETLKKIPQSTYYYHPDDNWSYGIDIERDGKEDIIISDPAKRIKEIMPAEGGYKITLNTDAERKY